MADTPAGESTYVHHVAWLGYCFLVSVVCCMLQLLEAMILLTLSPANYLRKVTSLHLNLHKWWPTNKWTQTSPRSNPNTSLCQVTHTSLVLRLSDRRKVTNSPPKHILLPPREPGDEATHIQCSLNNFHTHIYFHIHTHTHTHTHTSWQYTK